MAHEPYVVTPPGSAYMTLSTAKQWCRITDDDTSQDSIITPMIVVAANTVQNSLRSPLLPTQYGWKLDGFYQAWDHAHNYMDNLAYRFGFNIYGVPIHLPFYPLISVDQIQWIQQSGSVATLDPSTYVVDTYNLVPRLYPAYGAVWPVPQPIQNNVTITFTAGYATVPEAAQLAMGILINDWYFNRDLVALGTVTPQVQNALNSILSPLMRGASGVA